MSKKPAAWAPRCARPSGPVITPVSWKLLNQRVQEFLGSLSRLHIAAIRVDDVIIEAEVPGGGHHRALSLCAVMGAIALEKLKAGAVDELELDVVPGLVR